jgi:hypothetical protein
MVPTPDHTSGTLRCWYRILGAHVHCRIFGPYAGKAGDLVFRVEEWQRIRSTQPWEFVDEDGQ